MFETCLEYVRRKNLSKISQEIPDRRIHSHKITGEKEERKKFKIFNLILIQYTLSI